LLSWVERGQGQEQALVLEQVRVLEQVQEPGPHKQ